MPASIPATAAYANLWRGRAQQPGGDRHPRQAAADRARGVLRRLWRQEISSSIIQGASGAFGNAATRLEAFVVKGGAYAYGSYPEIDELFPQQADELDRAKARRDPDKDAAARLREGDVCADLAARLSSAASGRGSANPSFGLIKGFVYTAPYEDITLKGHSPRSAYTAGLRGHHETQFIHGGSAIRCCRCSCCR